MGIIFADLSPPVATIIPLQQFSANKFRGTFEFEYQSGKCHKMTPANYGKRRQQAPTVQKYKMREYEIEARGLQVIANAKMA
jgi:hypothetical protein